MLRRKDEGGKEDQRLRDHDDAARGAVTSFVGAYASYFLDGATGGIIVVAQTLIFLAAFVFAPKLGLLAARRRAREALEAGVVDEVPGAAT